MEETLNKISEFITQAWVYIPAILTFITGIGLPSLVQISKIFSSAKLYLTQAKTIGDKVNVVIDTTNDINKVCSELLTYMVDDLRSEIEFKKQELAMCYNPKQKELLENRIEQLESKVNFYSNITRAKDIEKIKESDLTKKKVKVKVVKK